MKKDLSKIVIILQNKAKSRKKFLYFPSRGKIDVDMVGNYIIKGWKMIKGYEAVWSEFKV